MLSLEQREREHLYRYRSGMLNVAWIAGVARQLTKRGGFIQRSDNLNQMIPFELAEGDAMRPWVREGCNLKILARLLGAREDGEPVVVLRALDMSEPDILDMPPRQAFERVMRPGIPTDAVRPTAYGPDRTSSADGLEVTDKGNVAWVAGYVASFFVERVPLEDGTLSRGCLVVGLRQTANPEDILPVRCYAARPEELARHLRVGDPVKMIGRMEVRLKNTGEVDAQGVLAVRKRLHLRVSAIKVVNADDIRERPTWVDEMSTQASSRRTRGATSLTIVQGPEGGQASASHAQAAGATEDINRETVPVTERAAFASDDTHTTPSAPARGAMSVDLRVDLSVDEETKRLLAGQ